MEGAHEFQSTLPQGERRHARNDPCSAVHISIHAPTRGATTAYLVIPKAIRISIHAPTRGATKYTPEEGTFRLHFNPRSHKGSDSVTVIVVFLSFVFQSTLPQGERHKSSPGAICRCDFNPRSHKGSDNARSRFDYLVFQFQSTLTNKTFCGLLISIHAPTRGATICKSLIFLTT